MSSTSTRVSETSGKGCTDGAPVTHLKPHGDFEGQARLPSPDSSGALKDSLSHPSTSAIGRAFLASGEDVLGGGQDSDTSRVSVTKTAKTTASELSECHERTESTDTRGLPSGLNSPIALLSPEKEAADPTAAAGRERKPVIVGIFGLPGTGKTYLLNRLKEYPGLSANDYEFVEGSVEINDGVPGGLRAFKQMPGDQQTLWRERTIDGIAKRCAEKHRTGVVTGHYMFWNGSQSVEESLVTADPPEPVLTGRDWDAFTHIFYLDIAPETIQRQRLEDGEDGKRSRPAVSVEHLYRWQRTEREQLRRLCRERGVLFSVVRDVPQACLVERIAALLDWCSWSECEEEMPLGIVKSLQKELGNFGGNLGTVLFLDADKTLAPDDAGMLFWEHAIPRKRYFKGSRGLSDDTENCSDRSKRSHPLKALFESPLRYSFEAFQQASLLYDECIDDDKEYESVCRDVASKITMYPEIKKLLEHVQTGRRRRDGIHAVVVTSGLKRVWDTVLANNGIRIPVVGGGPITARGHKNMVISPKVKAELVRILREKYRVQRVLAMGDSPVDIPMLCEADEAIVVVGAENTRSKSMDKALREEMNSGALRGAHQVLLPRSDSSVAPRLDARDLPLVDITSREFLVPLVSYFELTFASATASCLLSAPTRDARLSGPALQEAHRRVGWYLAVGYVAPRLTLEEYAIPHVQGHNTQGHRLRDEARTLIVALMRGGEPMARGVLDAFPEAMFVHAKRPEDLTEEHVRSGTVRNVLLVDSVVNTGKTVVEFSERVRELDTAARTAPARQDEKPEDEDDKAADREKNAEKVVDSINIMVVAGVVQAGALDEGADFVKGMKECRVGGLVALRKSDNKFTGTRHIDTGNRLFNTMHLD